MKTLLLASILLTTLSPFHAQASSIQLMIQLNCKVPGTSQTFKAQITSEENHIHGWPGGSAESTGDLLVKNLKGAVVYQTKLQLKSFSSATRCGYKSYIEGKNPEGDEFHRYYESRDMCGYKKDYKQSLTLGAYPELICE